MFSANQFICLHCQLPMKIRKRQKKMKRKLLFISVESKDRITGFLLWRKQLSQKTGVAGGISLSREIFTLQIVDIFFKILPLPFSKYSRKMKISSALVDAICQVSSD